MFEFLLFCDGLFDNLPHIAIDVDPGKMPVAVGVIVASALVAFLFDLVPDLWQESSHSFALIGAWYGMNGLYKPRHIIVAPQQLVD